MKRFLLALASLALLSVTVFSDAALAGRVFPGRARFEPLMWRSYMATGNVDSLYANLGPNGLAAGSKDTSAVFSLSRMAGVGATHATTNTAFAMARLWLYTASAVGSVDTLGLVTVQVSNDGSTWFTALSDIGAATAGAGNKLACINLSHAMGTNGVNAGMQPSSWSLVRFIVGGTSNVIPNCELLLAFYDADETSLYSDESQALGKWVVEPIKWVSNSIDSATVSRVGSAAGTVTTTPFSMTRASTWKNLSSTNSYANIRLLLERTSAGTVTVDSAYAAIEVSVNGSDWSTWTEYAGSGTGFAGAVTNQHAYDIGSTDALTSNTGATTSQSRAVLVPFIRFRVKLPVSEGVVSTLKPYIGYMPAFK